MKWNSTLSGAAVAALLAFSAPAQAIIIDQGITYELQTQATADPLTNRFALLISGENTASDPIGNRTGITGFALNETSNGATASGEMIFTATTAGIVMGNSGWNFVNGNVNQGGCTNNPAPNFYCFDNSAVPPNPTDDLAGPLLFVFDVTLNPGETWAGYNPSFRIDWVSDTQNNYSFVSAPIGVTQGCPSCTPTPTSVVPEPASIAALGSGLVALAGAIGWRWRRRRKADLYTGNTLAS
jgi:hypothetical protein